jgi:hypothetical protein
MDKIIGRNNALADALATLTDDALLQEMKLSGESAES